MDVALRRSGLDAATARRSRRELAVVVLLVVLAHVWVLERSADIVQPGLPGAERLVTQPMQTRQIVIEPQAARQDSVPRVAPSAAARVAPRASAISVQGADARAPGTATTGAVRAEEDPGAAARDAGTSTAAPPQAAPPALIPTPTPTTSPPPASTALPATDAGRGGKPTASEPVAAAPGAQATTPAAATAATPATTAATTAGTPPLAIPGSTALRYVVSATSRGRPYQVNGTLQWQHDGERYQARLEISAFLLGARVQTSVGRISAEGLAPTRFGDRARSEQATHFQRDKGLISFSNNAPDAPLLPGAQDRLSVFLQLGALLAGAPQRYPPGTVVSLQTAGVRDAETWQFSVIGTETLQLPGGTLDAVKLLRLPRREFDQTIELWLAPTLQYLPARVRLTQGNGDVADQQWLSGGTP